MKALTSSYNSSINSSANSLNLSAKNQNNVLTSSAASPVVPLALAKVKITVLHKSLLLELQKLTKSFQAQVRNSVALLKWLHAKTGNNPLAVSSSGQEILSWQSSFGESLTFRFSTSTEAFVLFSETLLRKSYFLHHHAQVDSVNQLIKVRVTVNRLPEFEQELSIVFENIKPGNYLETQLLQKQQTHFAKKQAG